jgi:SAM-dependent methyltransferase
VSLRDASFPLTSGPALPGEPPYPCTALTGWVDLDFELPPGDVRLRAVDRGGAEPTPAFANLVGARRVWDEHPLWMDYLDPASPVRETKLLERGLYLHHWAPALFGVRRLLDLGGSIGRFSTWCLDSGMDVELVDPDMCAIRRAVSHAAGRPGRFDAHWSTGEELPDLAPVDAVIAAEVLNYVERPDRVLARIREVLAPGGPLLLSVEARWGWPLAGDAPPGNLPQVGAEVLHVPGDRFVRTFDEVSLRALLADWTIELLIPTHYVLAGPFELVAGDVDLHALLAAEARFRAHPVYGPLNRAWTVIAR